MRLSRELRTHLRLDSLLDATGFSPRPLPTGPPGPESAASEAAARELRSLGLLDAVDLCVLIATEAPERYERAARRPLVRLLTERERMTPDDAQLAIACLRGLRPSDTDRLAGALRVLAGARWSTNGNWR
jgi:hypothetical protein